MTLGKLGVETDHPPKMCAGLATGRDRRERGAPQDEPRAKTSLAQKVSRRPPRVGLGFQARLFAGPIPEQFAGDTSAFLRTSGRFVALPQCKNACFDHY